MSIPQRRRSQELLSSQVQQRSTFAVMSGKRARVDTAAGSTEEFCHACGKTHAYKKWHETESDFTYCHAHYVAAARFLPAGEPRHPTWVQMVKDLEITDVTGHHIARLRDRPDARAIRSVAALARKTNEWDDPGSVMFFIGYALQCFWVYGMMELWGSMKHLPPRQVTAATLRAQWQTIEHTFENMSVRDGALVDGVDRRPGGLHPLKNPSERRPGSVRFNELAEEVDAWRDCCAQLAELCRHPAAPVDLEHFLAIVGRSNLATFGSGVNYKNMRLARALSIAVNMQFEDNEAAWKCFRSMSAHVQHVVKASGLWAHSDALLFRDALRKRLGDPSYSFNDLTCFVCLMPKHAGYDD